MIADRVHIGIVLSNLLPQQHRGFGRTHGRKPRHQRRHQGPTEGLVEFTVSDNGPGFPPGFSFEKHEVGRSSKPNGLGIGLGICRSIIEAHGGKIFVVPRPDGATVGFTLRKQQQGLHA